MRQAKELTIAELRERENKRRERVQRQNDNFNAKVDRVTFTVEKGRKEEIQTAAAKLGLSVNAYVSELVLTDVARVLSDEKEESSK